MVSYYNPLPYSQKHGANLPYPAQSWFSSNYHHPPNHQYLGDVEAGAHGHNVYYSPHMFPQSSPDWVAHENFQTAQQASLLQQSQHTSASGGIGAGGGSGNSSAGGGGGGSSGSGSTPTTIHLHPHHHPGNPEHFTEGLPSPPITVSGSEMSSPGGANGAPSPQNSASNRATPGKSPYYDWMKKPSYVTQPNPGKTRTKDKYRVVYTDFQRLELEKEYHTSRYITIRRKTELAQTLQLSERQVKIWFQNRRAKERKQTKKRDDPLSSGLGQHSSPGSIVSMLDNKPKLDGSSLHLQHPLHQMSSMAMGMPPMSLHHPVLHHIGAPPPPPQHHLHHPHSQVSTPTSAGPVSM